MLPTNFSKLHEAISTKNYCYYVNNLHFYFNCRYFI